ncbi:hypothetical protein P9D77_19530 [Bacillus rugosus]|nr:hypothetical protein [Bacillus rugosus]MEC1550463.1 hypothetical protein [Bacillus rugosus]
MAAAKSRDRYLTVYGDLMIVLGASLIRYVKWFRYVLLLALRSYLNRSMCLAVSVY